MSRYPIDLHFMPTGIRIETSELCVFDRSFCEVVKTNPRARRKRYRSVKRTIGEPTAYWCTDRGGYYLMHPSLLEKLKERIND